MADEMGKMIGGLAMIVGATVVVLYLAGFHIKHRPTADQLFGCKHTYVNARGEDTGECQ